MEPVRPASSRRCDSHSRRNGSAVENLAQAFDLWPQVARVIADEKATVVSDVCVHNLTHGVVLEILNHVVAKETAPCNDAIADSRFLESRHDTMPIDVQPRIQDDGKGEPRAARPFQLTLDDEPIIAGEQRLKQRSVVPAN